MELISTQRMSYEAWLRTWNLTDEERDDDDDDDERDFDGGFDGGGDDDDGKASVDDLSRLRRKAILEQKDEKTRCAICLACFVEKTKTTTKKDEEEEEEEDALCYAVEMPCKHIYHEACIRRWLRRSRRCPTCRKSLREKKIQKAKNGSEERLLVGPIGERGNDDASARHIQRDEELDRERAAMRQSQGQQEIEELARERRAREEEEERKAMRRSRIGMVLEHEGMNEEIRESYGTRDRIVGRSDDWERGRGRCRRCRGRCRRERKREDTKDESSEPERHRVVARRNSRLQLRFEHVVEVVADTRYKMINTTNIARYTCLDEF